MANTKKPAESTTNLSMSNEDLMKMIFQLKAELDSIKKSPLQEMSVEEDVTEEELIEIPMSKSIKIVSLFNGGLTLYTQARGTGKPYRFNNFGSTRTIVYSDLIDCIAHQTRYFTDGYVMILDKDVNKVQGFEEDVKRFLTKQQIENILNFDTETITKMLKNTTKNILDTVVETVTFRLVEGKDVDMNKVKCISDVYGRDINEIVSMLKESK